MENNPQNSRLGKILLEQNLITEDQLETALAKQQNNGGQLGKILIDEKFITDDSLARALAVQKNLDLVDLDEYQVDPKASALINLETARRHKLIPIGFRGGKLLVAIANPLDVYAIDTVQVATGMRVELVVATERGIDDAIGQYVVGASHLRETMLAAARVKKDGLPVVEVEDELPLDEDAPVVKLANEILTLAFKMRASDVHIENEEKDVKVRFRVDGVLREEMTIPLNLRALLVSRFKIMSGMDIAERRHPQDGRVAINVDGQRVQLRVASLPTTYGENITIRLLTSSSGQIKLANLGLDEDIRELYREAFHRSYGAIINTGPTGSGKTTTLYATLMELNTRAKKIITLEDPVEFSLAGISQMQINRKAGLEFATGLRAIVRADPDIIMVGEIRDLETAQMAVRAAMTGHLVLSSLHTNDAASAVTRLVDMGVDPFLVTSSIRGVLAQRLARLLCPNCKQETEYSPRQLELMGIAPEDGNQIFYKPGSCRRCLNTGYKGRIGLFEFMPISEEINRLCVNRASSAQIKDRAVEEGMRTLYEDGLIKARRGLVSLEEVRRVVL
jgi:type IV pilus assembly protein PilB